MLTPPFLKFQETEGRNRIKRPDTILHLIFGINTSSKPRNIELKLYYHMLY